jgi:hypothetical protein
MTPERIEEIKAAVEEFGQLGGPAALELLAALEEGQQQRDEYANKEEEARWESAKWCEDLIKANEKLAESQLLINEYRIAVGNCYSVISRRRKEAFEAQQTIEALRLAKDYEIELHAQSCIEYQQTIARQREALEWYSDKANYQYEVPTSGYLRFISPVQVDDGARARAALGEGAKES